MDEEKKKERTDKWYYSFMPNNMAGGSTQPLIPLFLTEGLGGSVALVGLLSALSSMATVPSNILWGNLSDAVKKRRIFVIIGFTGMAISLLMMGLSTTIWTYLLANVLLGLISTAAVPIGTVLILESYNKEEWAKRLGDFSRVGGIGWVVGLFVGTIWLILLDNGAGAVASMRALFLLAAALAGVSILLACLWVVEPAEKVDRATAAKHVGHVSMMTMERARYLPQRVLFVMKLSTKNLKIHNFPRKLLLFYIYSLITWTGFLCFYVGLPIFLKQSAGMSNAEIFIIYLASSLASAITYSQAGKWVQRFGGKHILNFAISMRIILFPMFFLVIFLPITPIELLLAFCGLHAMLGFCWANISVSGNSIVSNSCLSEFRAESSGMYNAIIGAGSVAGALIGGIIAESFGYLVVFVAASCMLIAGLSVLYFIKLDKAAIKEKDKKHDPKEISAKT